MMKSNNLLHITIQNMRIRKKHIVFSSLLLVLTLLVFLSGFTFNLALNTFLKEVVYEIPLAKMLYFNLPKELHDNVYNAIVLGIQEGDISEGNRLYYGIHGTVDSDMLTGGMTLNFYNQAYENLVLNQESIEHDNTGKIILPKYLLLNNTISDTLIEIKQPDFIDGEDYIGQTIDMHFIHTSSRKVIAKSFVVSGTYDNSLSFDDASNALISYSELVSLSEQLGVEQTGLSQFYVIAKDFTKIGSIKQSFSEQIKSEGAIRAVFNFDSLILFMKLSKLITVFIGSLLIVCSAVYISMSTIKNIETRSVEIGVLKVLGYNSKQIKRLFIYENIFVICISIAITFILHMISVYTLNLVLHKFGQFQIRNMDFTLHPILALVIFFSTFVIVYFLSLWKVKKIDALESINILKSN